MNLNYSHEPEYSLYNSLTNELISIYGVLAKYIVTEKVSVSENTFGEWTSLKAENDDVFEVYLLPDTQETYQGQNIMFDQFGLGNFSTMDFFISEGDLHTIFPKWEESVGFNDMVSDLLLMPSGKVLEITHVEPLVEGVNNLFAYDDPKNTIKITTRNYTFRKNDEVDIESITNDYLTPAEEETNTHLDEYFTRLLDSDIIPDEEYVNKPGKTSIIDYNMSISDIMFIADSLVINGIDSGSTTIQNAEESKIIESSYSIKTKQDKNSTREKKEINNKPVVEKEDDYSSPFGDLGN